MLVKSPVAPSGVGSGSRGAVTFAARLKEALEDLNWTGRHLSREAGLPSETHVGRLLKDVDNPRIETMEKLADRLAQEGYSRTWLLVGEGPKKTTGGVDRARRYSFARSVEKALVLEDRCPPDVAERIVGSIVFAEGDSGSDPLSLYLLARNALRAERGEPIIGDEPVAPGELEPKRRTTKKRRKKAG